MTKSSTILRAPVLRRVLADPERKSVARMLWEVACCWRARSERPGHYFKNLLYHRHVARPESYLTQRECSALWALDRDPNVAAFLADKLRAQRHFESVAGVRMPRYLGHARDGWFWGPSGGRRALISTDDAERALAGMFSELEGAATVFAKPIEGRLGRGALKLSGPHDARRLREAMAQTPYLFQETVRQHAALAALMPDTLNALRVTTLREPGSAPVVGSVWLKTGRRGEVADNTTGMLVVGVDMETGRLLDRARSRFSEGAASYTHHPDTHVRFGGVHIPMLPDVRAMALAAAEEVETPLVGWDIAVAEDGPVLLEGNRGPSYYVDEIANELGYRDHLVFGPYVRRTLSALGSE